MLTNDDLELARSVMIRSEGLSRTGVDERLLMRYERNKVMKGRSDNGGLFGC